jgi:hypothetical protein
LDSKHQRIATENAIQGINDRHQMGLPVMLDERDLSEEIRLHDGQRRDFAQRDSGLFIPVLWAIDSVESGERLSDQFGSKRSWPKMREAVIRCKVASQGDDFPFLSSLFAHHRCF